MKQKLVAEFLGTAALVFVAASSLCVNAGPVGVALAYGLATIVLTTALGHISGGHCNPAVTIGLFVGGKMTTGNSIAYVIVQLLGGVVGALAVKSIIPPAMVEAARLGTPMLAATMSFGPGVLMEMVLTFLLVVVFFGTIVDERAPKMGGMFVGLAVVFAVLAGGPLTGASMNPARTFGSALAGWFWTDHLVYWIGPLLGGSLAGLLHKSVLGRR